MKRVIVRVITILVLAALIISSPSGTPLIQIASAQSSTNLALGKLAIADSQKDTYAPSKATDGLLSTRWSSEFSDPSWIYVDLGAPMAFEQIVLIWEAAYGRDYRIEGSNDATTWTLLAQIVNANGGTDYISRAGSWRYVRMYGTRRGTGWGFSLLEFQIFDIAQAIPAEYPIPPAPPPRTTVSTLFSDDFNDMDITDWQIISGNWSDSTGTMSTSVPCFTGPYVIVNGEENWTDFQLSLDFKRLNGWDYGGILLRYSESGYYQVEINPSIPYGGWVKISKFGIGEVASRPWPFVSSNWDHLVIDVERDTIEIYALDANQNAELLLSYTDPAPILSGKIGFSSRAGAVCPTQVQYDNVSVKSINPTFRVSGKIVDNMGNPIPQVDLSLSTSNATTFTDVLGNYALQRILQGAYSLFASKPGYKFSPNSLTVNLDRDRTGQNFVGEPNNPPVAPSWLLMYYMAGDNNLSAALSAEYSNLVANLQPNIDVAFFYDSIGSDSLYRYFPSNGSRETIAKGNLNSGDGSTLSDFITWAKQKSSAPNVALIIADHGHGLAGVAWDDRNGKDYIKVKNKELRNALIASGPVDVIFNHTCLTGNLEFMWELRNLVDYYVASESTIWLPMLHDYIEKINQTTTSEDLARSMAESYYNFRNNNRAPSTISVLDMAYINDMFIRTNNLALAIQQAPMATKTSLWYFLDSTVLQRFDEDLPPDGIDNADRLADLFHFADLVEDFAELSTAAQALLGIEDLFVIYDQAWSGIPEEGVEWKHYNARGVSIALPLNPISFYDGEWLEFASGADWSFIGPTVQASVQVEGYNWGPMISELIAQNNPEGEDEPLPPDPVSPLVRYEIYLPMLTR